MTGVFSGGCQCGAVRYRATARPASPHLCFCRMCQKAVGNYFAALASVSNEHLVLTRGEPSWFRSSDLVRRGFCSQCGTPLFYQEVGGSHIALLLGSLDEPALVPPEWQSDIYAKPGWFAGLDTLPDSAGDAAPVDESERYAAIANTNHQHPDRDTETWPQRNSR